MPEEDRRPKTEIEIRDTSLTNRRTFEVPREHAADAATEMLTLLDNSPMIERNGEVN